MDQVAEGDLCDTVVLAGGIASPQMADLTGTPVRALFPYKGRWFADWVMDALRATPLVGRICIVGPPALQSLAVARSGDVFVLEGAGIEENLFGALAALGSNRRVLLTASDNPLLTPDAFQDYLARSPLNAAATYPILRYTAFQHKFAGATNTPIRLRDDAYIGGGCALVHSNHVDELAGVIRRILGARKSLVKMVRLLGPMFCVQFALRLATAADVERRVRAITQMPIHFIPDCSPRFAVDIDDPVDWQYLHDWTAQSDSAYQP